MTHKNLILSDDILHIDFSVVCDLLHKFSGPQPAVAFLNDVAGILLVGVRDTSVFQQNL